MLYIIQREVYTKGASCGAFSALNTIDPHEITPRVDLYIVVLRRGPNTDFRIIKPDGVRAAGAAQGEINAGEDTELALGVVGLEGAEGRLLPVVPVLEAEDAVVAAAADAGARGEDPRQEEEEGGYHGEGKGRGGFIAPRLASTRICRRSTAYPLPLPPPRL